MGEQRKIRVAVVFGGRSAEHAVSCASAGLVLGAIDRDRYEVVPIGIARDGRWVLTSGDPARLALGSGELPSVEAIAAPGVSVTPRTGPGAGSLVITGPSEVPADLGEVDVVLPLLHGTYGEDGTIQGLLEMTGIRYAGAGVLASAAGMDKEYMKLLFTARGLPVGPYVVVRDRDWGPAAPAAERKRVLDEIAELGWPVFVKPARGGSSIGTTRVISPADLEAAVEDARRYDRKVLVEAAIDGAEVECAVLEGVDGGAPEASVPGQVVVDSHSPFYDFEAKYLGAETRMEIPAPIPAAAAERIRQLACAAFDAISCEGLARVDFFYTPAGEILVNEINTMPGMTPSSGFPMMWAASGLPLPALIDRIIQTALAKQNGSRLSRAVGVPRLASRRRRPDRRSQRGQRGSESRQRLGGRVRSHDLALDELVDRRARPRVDERDLRVTPLTRMSLHAGAPPRHGQHRVVVEVPRRAIRPAVILPFGAVAARELGRPACPVQVLQAYAGVGAREHVGPRLHLGLGLAVEHDVPRALGHGGSGGMRGSGTGGGREPQTQAQPQSGKRERRDDPGHDVSPPHDVPHLSREVSDIS
jgi:D-alanine-D-alanine ligase